MKFDIIEALQKANEVVGYECTITCSRSEGAYLIRVTVIIPYPVPMRGSHVYNQQVAFTYQEMTMCKWDVIGERFHNAVESLKLQIEADKE